MPPQTDKERIDKLEKDIQDLTKSIHKLATELYKHINNPDGHKV